MKYENKELNNKGSTLILLVIILALLTTMGSFLLVTASAYYEIKISNSELKKSFYKSETGINLAYVITLELVKVAVNNSIDKAEDFLILNPGKLDEAKNIFTENYKLIILGQLENRLKSDLDNPSVNIMDPMVFVGESLTVTLESVYISDINVEKAILSNLVIKIPIYDEVIKDDVDFSNLVSLNTWEIKL